MTGKKQVIGGPYVSRGRTLSLSKAVRAGDFVFLTGVVPRIGDAPMTTGSIEDQTRVVCETIKATLAEAGEFFPVEPPARSAVLNELLVDVRVEVEVVAYRPTT
jgi:2-iminobutanoate/2-iminopropanoate deaminase